MGRRDYSISTVISGSKGRGLGLVSGPFLFLFDGLLGFVFRSLLDLY